MKRRRRSGQSWFLLDDVVDDKVVVFAQPQRCRVVLLKIISVVLMSPRWPASDTGEQFPLLYEHSIRETTTELSERC